MGLIRDTEGGCEIKDAGEAPDKTQQPFSEEKKNPP